MMRMFAQTNDQSSLHLTQDVIRLCALVTVWIAVTTCLPSNAAVLLVVKCSRLASLPIGTSTVPFLAGESVKFLCRTLSGGVVRESVKWSMNGRELSEAECPTHSSRDCTRLGSFGDEMLLTDLRSEDSGKIRCYTNHSVSSPLTISVIDSNSNSSAPYIWNRGNQTAVVGSSVTIVFLTTNVDGFLFWKNHRDVIQTGMGSRYDNTMNGYLTIRDVVKEDEGWITLQAMNTTTRQEVTASLYLKVVPGPSTSHISTPTAYQDTTISTAYTTKIVQTTFRQATPTNKSLINDTTSSTKQSAETPTFVANNDGNDIDKYIGSGVGVLFVVVVVVVVYFITKRQNQRRRGVSDSDDTPDVTSSNSPQPADVPLDLVEVTQRLINIEQGVEKSKDLGEKTLSQVKVNGDLLHESRVAHAEDTNEEKFSQIAGELEP
ncbi:uncharacterized protein LOC134177125 isoform X2 [Corticium candelabrum]|uniref:uncharacterized protein LOC134177125 isoform X2 n=1 Tax=Corticium candelabrum TaxID=121492 RepID=UPI002E25EF57|nr:uncharacterized protein LOC134177125 isoform X2 [Corticium candelabrum]